MLPDVQTQLTVIYHTLIGQVCSYPQFLFLCWHLLVHWQCAQWFLYDTTRSHWNPFRLISCLFRGCSKFYTSSLISGPLTKNLQFFDWMLTFDLEVEFIWNSDWSLMKTVYLMDRFLPIVEFILAMIRKFILNFLQWCSCWAAAPPGDHGFLPTSSCKPMYAVSGCEQILVIDIDIR